MVMAIFQARDQMAAQKRVFQRGRRSAQFGVAAVARTQARSARARNVLELFQASRKRQARRDLIASIPGQSHPIAGNVALREAPPPDAATGVCPEALP